MNKYIRLYAPEGDSGAGAGSAAVADAPPPAKTGGSDLSEMSMGDAIASTFKTEPRQRDRREPRKEKEPVKNEQKAPDKKDVVPPKAEVKPETKPAETAPEKRTSIFDTPMTKPAETQTAPGEFVDAPDGDWPSAKALRKKLHVELDAAKQELAQYHELVPDREETKRKLDEHKTFSDRIAVLDYQNHPDYKRQFTEPKEKLLGDMKTILTENGVDNFDVRQIAALPRAEMAKAISDVTAKMNSFDQGEFRLQLRDYQKLVGAETAALGNHKETVAKLTQQAQAKQRTAFEGKWKTTSLATFAQKLDPPSDASPEEAAQIKALNQGIDGIRNTAEKYAFGLGDEAQAADVAIKAANYDFVVGHAFPRMQADYAKLKTDYAAAIQKLKDLNGHKPGSNFDGSAPAAETTSEEADIKTQVRRVFRS